MPVATLISHVKSTTLMAEICSASGLGIDIQPRGDRRLETHLVCVGNWINVNVTAYVNVRVVSKPT